MHSREQLSDLRTAQQLLIPLQNVREGIRGEGSTWGENNPANIKQAVWTDAAAKL